jgi:hypothetical protein
MIYRIRHDFDLGPEMRPIRFFGEMPELNIDRVMQTGTPDYVLVNWNDRSKASFDIDGKGAVMVVAYEGIFEIEIDKCPLGGKPKQTRLKLVKTRNGDTAVRTRVVCPECQRNTSKIYYCDFRWSCSKCHKIKYKSQYPSEGPRDYTVYDRLAIEAHRPRRKNEHWLSYKNRQQAAKAKLDALPPLDDWDRDRQFEKPHFTTTYLRDGE